MDLPVAGRAALAVVAPVLSALGVQACCLPAALFSTHTGGFGPVERQDVADFGKRALAHFAREGIDFDAVYTGYLYGEEQFALAAAAFEQYPGALHLADPALGDEGRPYSGLGEGAVPGMAALCAAAQLITPNLTESALLCGADPAEIPGEAALHQRLRALSRLGGGHSSVLITSVPAPGGAWQTLGLDAAHDDEIFALPSRRVPQGYPGTGDTYSAAVLGLLLAGEGLRAAAQRAGQFVEAAAAATYEGGGEAREGLWLEAALPLLWKGGEGP